MHFAGGRSLAMSKANNSSKKTELDLIRELKIQNIPSFTMNQTKENDDIIPRVYDYKPMILRRFPFFFWFIGFSFLAAALLVTYNIIVGYDVSKRLFNVFVGKSAWEYGILILMYIFGISFFVVAKYEYMRIDKSKGEMILSKYYLFCCERKTVTLQLGKINAIFPVRIKTHESSQASSSCLYKIGIRFNEYETIYLMKSLFKYFIIRDVMKLRSYALNKYCTYRSVKLELESRVSYIDVMG